jgi:hypothetical protein
VTPSFNYIGEIKKLYCADHKKDDMINVNKTLCNHFGCIKMPCYNLSGECKGLYCMDHKTDDMINVRKYRTCLDCDKRSCFNYSGEKNGLYCSEHKKEDMVNVIGKNVYLMDVAHNPLLIMLEKKKSYTVVRIKKKEW